MVQAGRGFGKTRIGAEWIREQAKDPKARLAIVGRTAKDVRNTMINGVSGLMSCYPSEERPDYRSSKGLIIWPNGAIAETFSADKPDQLRGPQFTGAWCDEIAAWLRGPETWDNLVFGLRIGDNPQTVITSTPKPVPLVKDLVKDPLTVVTAAQRMKTAATYHPSFGRACQVRRNATRPARVARRDSRRH